MSEPAKVFAELMAVIEDRKANPPARSYTTSLFAAGVDKIGGKILEEAQEVVDEKKAAELEKLRAELEMLNTAVSGERQKSTQLQKQVRQFQQTHPFSTSTWSSR